MAKTSLTQNSGAFTQQKVLQQIKLFDLNGRLLQIAIKIKHSDDLNYHLTYLTVQNVVVYPKYVMLKWFVLRGQQLFFEFWSVRCSLAVLVGFGVDGFGLL